MKIDVNEKTHEELIEKISEKNPELIEKFKDDQELNKEIGQITPQSKIDYRSPPLSLKSLQKLYGIYSEDEDIEKSNEFALWSGILLRYFNDNEFGLYISFEDGLLEFPDDTDFVIEPVSTPDIKQAIIEPAIIAPAPAIIAPAPAISVYGGGGADTQQHSGSETFANFVHYGLRSTEVDWLYMSSLPHQSKNNMILVLEEFKRKGINDI